MKASHLTLNSDFPHFPELIDYDIPLELIDSRVITTLQQMRYALGHPIHPSPLRDAWARLDGKPTSQHYAVGRLSKAGDIFPARGRLMACWLVAQQITDVRGLGLYSDTNGPDGDPWPMMHFDLRNVKRVFWVREGGQYFTLNGVEDRDFWRVVRQLIRLDMEYRR